MQNKPTAAVLPVLLLTDTFNEGGTKTQGSGTEESMLSAPPLVTNTYEFQGSLKSKMYLNKSGLMLKNST